MYAGKDVWSRTKADGKKSAQGANMKGEPIYEIDKINGKPKKGYYYHWHTYKRSPKAHSFVGNAYL